MRGSRLFFVALAVALATGAFVLAPRSAIEPARTAPESPAEEPEFVPGRALVATGPGNRAEVADRIRTRGGRVDSFYAPGDFFIVETPGRAPAFVDAIRAARGVRFAELDYVVTAEETIPNDPRWADLWGLRKIGSPTAWDTSRGSPAVVVGVIDTGVDHGHPDLAGQMWVNRDETPGNGLDDDANGYVDDVHGADCVNGDGNPMDDNNHGTHVAGTIGAATNNGTGIAGVNWNVSIMALKFLTATGSGSTSAAIRCIDYAISEGATLTNNSWGGAGYSQSLADAIARARDAGQLFVAAAGNEGSDNDAAPRYPASYDLANVLTVAATDAADALATFSNRGATSVDLAAPGVGIVSTVPGGYASFSGTSMATPHVAGAAALVHAANPASTWTDVRNRILATVDVAPALVGKVVTGGRLNAARALVIEAAPAPSPSPEPSPSASPSVSPVPSPSVEPSPSPAPSPPPPSRTYAPSSVSIAKGSGLGDPLANLSEDDGARYRVGSVPSGSKHVTSYYAQGTVDGAGATALTLTYDGSASRSVNQTLWVYRFSAGSWERFSSATLSTTDKRFTWSTPSPAAYVSSSGLVRLRVMGSSAASHVERSDLIRFTLDY